MSHPVENIFSGALSFRAQLFSQSVGWAEICNPTSEFLQLVRYVDHRLDSLTLSERFTYRQKLKKFLTNGDNYPDSHTVDSEELFLSRQVYSRVNSLPKETQQHFHAKFSELLIVTEELRQETNIKNYINLTVSEAKIMTDLLWNLLPNEKLDPTIYPQLLKVATIRNLIDNALDLNSDYQEGKTQILPIKKNKIQLLSAAWNIIHKNIVNFSSN